MCHNAESGLPIPDFTQFENVAERAKTDTGASFSSLARVSHIHLFGIAFIFFFVGLIFSLSVGISPLLKTTVIVMPFVFLMVDVLSWWLTKIHPNFAWLTIIAGAGYTIASAYMWTVCIAQMWWYPFKGKQSDENTWF